MSHLIPNTHAPAQQKLTWSRSEASTQETFFSFLFTRRHVDNWRGGRGESGDEQWANAKCITCTHPLTYTKASGSGKGDDNATSRRVKERRKPLIDTSMSKAGGKGGAKAAVATVVKLLVPAGSASAQPPVGPALGAKGVKAIDFAKEFNARTVDLEPGLLTPTIVTIQPDRTFSFRTLTPPTSLLLKRAANITTGARKPGAEVTGTISIKHVYEIAKIKMKDVHITEKEVRRIYLCLTCAQMCKVVAGSARSLGIKIVR